MAPCAASICPLPDGLLGAPQTGGHRRSRQATGHKSVGDAAVPRVQGGLDEVRKPSTPGPADQAAKDLDELKWRVEVTGQQESNRAAGNGACSGVNSSVGHATTSCLCRLAILTLNVKRWLTRFYLAPYIFSASPFASMASTRDAAFSSSVSPSTFSGVSSRRST